ncbi:MAG: hypothetical protein JXL84_20975 [Deltaproteobacteria bacterium]|nr:hypothetical protein [Deltaproteobacteria bacterium]
MKGKAVHPLFALAVALFLVSLSVMESPARSLLPLDEEAIFCLYHKLSGEPMTDQDIEDLCFSQGRAIFSAFKPTEMILRQGLNETRKRLLDRIRAYGKDSLFVWDIEGVFRKNMAGSDEWAARFLRVEMPHPTHFIRSTLLAGGEKLVERELNAFLSCATGVGSRLALKISLHLRPEGIDRQTEKRVIAHEEVHLPLRSVIFRPVAVRVSLPGSDDERVRRMTMECHAE